MKENSLLALQAGIVKVEVVDEQETEPVETVIDEPSFEPSHGEQPGPEKDESDIPQMVPESAAKGDGLEEAKNDSELEAKAELDIKALVDLQNVGVVVQSAKDEGPYKLNWEVQCGMVWCNYFGFFFFSNFTLFIYVFCNPCWLCIFRS